MREATFNTELVRSLKFWGAWAYKIPDIPTSRLVGMRYTPDKPCDVIGAYSNYFFAIESKQMKKFEAFGMRFIRESQAKELNLMTSKGNQAFIFLNIRIKAIKGGAKRENRLIIFKWTDFRDRTKSYTAKELKTLPYVGYQSIKKNKFDPDTEIMYDLKPFLVSLPYD